ncbi:MAG: triose-phosphate isomerase [Clostridia bacterium]|nr:triose-phosphate isomerase [Clostridia bacterium]
MRKPIIIGNWKMYKDKEEAIKLVEELKPLVAKAKVDVALCVPFTLIPVVKPLLEGTKIKLGAQNVAYEEEGAYTGEVSAKMLKDFDVEYVIVGHSERRRLFGEKCRDISLRAAQALKYGIKPIVCLGETLERRQRGTHKSYLKIQLLETFESIQDVSNVIIAYEPLWAVNTGVVATPEEANEATGYIRKLIKEKYGSEAAKNIRIQYGGSMNGGNAKGLLAMRNVDGGLIGKASLDAEAFAAIVNCKE